MDGLRDFLSRFKHLEAKEPKIIKLVCASLKEILGITVAESSVVLQRGIVFLQVSPTIKQAVLIKKEALLRSLKESDIAKDISDIR